MQRLERQYVGLFSARQRRTGTLWEGRYKSCLADSERYVLTRQRYSELNPVRARITDDPLTYRWSSCAAHLGQRVGSSLTPHPVWLALNTDPARRATLWRSLRDEALPTEQLTQIREYLQQQRAWGCDDFRAMVEADPPLRGHAPRTPPRKAE